MTQPILHFAYGSNLDAAQMRRRCPTAVPGPNATLTRHRLIFCGHSRRWGGGVASLAPDRRGVVAGRLYRLQPPELARLDRFEGCPAAYCRRRRLVALADGQRIWAHVYVVTGSAIAARPPSAQYFAVLNRAYQRLHFDRVPLASATLAALNEDRARTRLVFVYGTLRAGEHNHGLLRRARLVCTARSAPHFRLVDLGGFPAMVANGARKIAGEVYDVDGDTLAALDRLEGHPRFYERTVVALESGTEAHAYLLRPEQVQGRPVIPSGDWRSRARRAS